MTAYRLTRAAQQDLATIREAGVARWGRPQTRAYLLRLRDAFDLLAEMPEAGASASWLLPGLRRHPVAAHVVFYRATGRGIAIIRVLHGRMDAPARFGPG